MRRMTFRMAPMAHSSIRTRIVRDRKRAGVFACLAIVLIAAVFTVFLYVASFVTQYLGRFYFTVVASGTVFFCAVVARWNFEFVRARLIRQRIQAMWLRRFQAEGGRAFRTSRVVDRLARYGISTLTLQDRDVRLSLEQRHQRLAPILWALSIPLTTGLALVSFSLWQAAFRSTSADGFQELGALFAAFEGLLFVAVILAGAMSIASIAGPIETFFFRHRDDYAKLPRLVRRVTAGRRQRGAVVLRISDDHWRDAVTTALRAVDVAID